MHCSEFYADLMSSLSDHAALSPRLTLFANVARAFQADHKHHRYSDTRGRANLFDDELCAILLSATYNDPPTLAGVFVVAIWTPCSRPLQIRSVTRRWLSWPRASMRRGVLRDTVEVFLRDRADSASAEPRAIRAPLAPPPRGGR